MTAETQPAAGSPGGTEHSVVSQVHGLLKQLKQTNRRIHAFLPERLRAERLFSEATALDRRWPLSERRPPLWGIPTGVKDLFRVDGLQTRAGSTLPPRLFRGKEASAVSMLRRAGAVVLGKTAMDEFAYSEPPATRNPHNLAHTPGGSSGGSAAAVAAGLCPLALGTQTSRSIIGPAAFCGVVGFKPSYQRVPVDGVVPLAPSFDTVGWLAQDVQIAALAASELIQDWRSVAPATKPVIGVPDGFFLNWTLSEGLRAYEDHIAHLRHAGFEVSRVSFFSQVELEGMDSTALDLLHGEMARVHSAWFAEYASRYRPRTARAVVQGQAVTDDMLTRGRHEQQRWRERITTFMDTAGIDLWATPASGGPAPRGLAQTGWGGMTTLWSFAGLPCVSLPVGWSSDGLPMGLQLVGRFGEDEHLLAWAAQLRGVWSSNRDDSTEVLGRMQHGALPRLGARY